MRTPFEISNSFASRESLDGKRSFFLVGIGGAGMSALARMFAHRGFHVGGTDSTESVETERLWSEGIQVHIGHSGDPLAEEARVSETALIVSDAIDLKTSPEVATARELRVPILRRSQALGWLLKGYKVIAVTGTHGKTTTTGMLGAGLIEAGLDPLVVVGASIPDFQGPVREGHGEWAVVEACEAYDSFHDLDPYIVLLTNLELDHVDFHGNYENLRNSVVRFVNRVPSEGCLVYCAEDAGASEVAKLSTVRSVGYTIQDWGRVMQKEENILAALPGAFGEHNMRNASGAVTAAEQAGVVDASALRGIVRFKGAERRQQILYGGPTNVSWEGHELEPDGKIQERVLTIIDDYAHHPTEVAATLKSVRQRFFATVPPEVIEKSKGRITPPAGRLIVVFQPHLYSRTAPLIKEFADALSLADVVVLTDIYPARETPMAGVSSGRIAERITKPVKYVPSRHLLPQVVARMVERHDVVVGMGAGNISEFGPALIREWERLQGVGRSKRISVLYGGDSAEREVSLHSGRAIHAALERLGYESRLVDITELLLTRTDLSSFVGPDRPDLAFLAVHGTNAEDGAIQGLLELLHVPYTGSGIQASAICMDKALTKQILQQHGIQVPRGVLLSDPDQHFDIPPPVIVKPNAQGSTVGLSFVENKAELCQALQTAFAYDSSVLVEEWIQGMEISTPVLDNEALLPVEIAPVSGRYDFESKYTPGATEEIVPARLPKEVLARAQQIALKAHQAVGCEGATRTDAIVRKNERGEHEIFVLEINTLPGMTATSLLPNSAAAMGITFDELCRRLVEDALRRDAAKT